MSCLLIPGEEIHYPLNSPLSLELNTLMVA
jgi:hypothetical protein